MNHAAFQQQGASPYLPIEYHLSIYAVKQYSNSTLETPKYGSSRGCAVSMMCHTSR